MSTESGRDQTARVSRTPRTGPVGRVIRLLLAVALGWVTYDLWVDRTFIFAGTNPVHDPGLWIMTATLVYGLYELANLVGWGKRALAVLAVLAVAAAAIAVVWKGNVWTVPLTWLVWGFDVTGAVFVTLALLVAVAVGTPGCEIGVVRELARRRRRAPDDDKPLFCLAGLRALDAWERDRPWRRGR
ncbi:MAG: hypothetical protein GEV28_23450 [Actinophytocola sp.]|uniref:hypothetical protein n=1 Tax=Actinophytocola sp. TaxID=1872138 RepID=UPI0013263706|nr:hypothetical protein [Actinophytocola sp.]MPZ83187.1 hypothetical protein [Actinophytocola sp.]